MIDFFKNLDKFMLHKGLNDNKITIKANISNGLIGKARKRGSLSQDNISKILYAFPELNANWLFTGDGDMIKSDTHVVNEEHAPYKVLGKAADKLHDIQDIPLYDVMATASVVSLFKNPSSTEIIDTIHIPNMPKCDGAIVVTGDSMYPLIKSGDIVFYKTISDLNNSVLFGNMYIISVDIEGDEMLLVKYIHKGKDQEHLTLVSENKYHADKEIHIKHVLSMALVKGNVRFNFTT